MNIMYVKLALSAAGTMQTYRNIRVRDVPTTKFPLLSEKWHFCLLNFNRLNVPCPPALASRLGAFPLEKKENHQTSPLSQHNMCVNEANISRIGASLIKVK